MTRLVCLGACWLALLCHAACADEKVRLRHVVVNSTSIATIGFNQTRGVLEIQFTNGRIYRYVAVPKKIQQEFLRAPSRGKFYHEFIRGRYARTEMPRRVGSLR